MWFKRAHSSIAARSTRLTIILRVWVLRIGFKLKLLARNSWRTPSAKINVSVNTGPDLQWVEGWCTEVFSLLGSKIKTKVTSRTNIVALVRHVVLAWAVENNAVPVYNNGFGIMQWWLGQVTYLWKPLYDLLYWTLWNLKGLHLEIKAFPLDHEALRCWSPQSSKSGFV